MTEWHTISAKFTSKEKKILDILRDEYGLSHNLSLLDKKSDSSVIAQMEYVISIAKRYNHARTHYKDPRNRGIKGAKSVLGIYFLNEEMKLRFRKISCLMVPYYRARLWKRRVYVCLECGYKFTGLVKKETDILDCPNCE